MATLGKIDKYSLDSEEWTQYVERLEFFLTANRVTDDVQQKVILLSVIWQRTYKTLHSLITPDKLADKSFVALVKVLSDHFNPKPSCYHCSNWNFSIWDKWSRLLQLPVQHGKTPKYRCLSDEGIKIVREKLRNLVILVVDEISMVSHVTLLYIHLRLTEIFNTEDINNGWFGCKKILVFAVTTSIWEASVYTTN